MPVLCQDAPSARYNMQVGASASVNRSRAEGSSSTASVSGSSRCLRPSERGTTAVSQHAYCVIVSRRLLRDYSLSIPHEIWGVGSKGRHRVGQRFSNSPLKSVLGLAPALPAAVGTQAAAQWTLCQVCRGSDPGRQHCAWSSSSFRPEKHANMTPQLSFLAMAMLILGAWNTIATKLQVRKPACNRMPRGLSRGNSSDLRQPRRARCLWPTWCAGRTQFK